MIRLQQLCGNEAGDVCNLTTSMIDRSGDVWLARFAKHKTAGRARSVSCSSVRRTGSLASVLLRLPIAQASALRSLKRWRQEQRRANRVTPAGYGNSPGTNKLANPDWVPGDRYDPNSYRTSDCARDRSCLSQTKNPTIAQLQVWRDQYQWSPNQLRHSAGISYAGNSALKALK